MMMVKLLLPLLLYLSVTVNISLLLLGTVWDGDVGRIRTELGMELVVVGVGGGSSYASLAWESERKPPATRDSGQYMQGLTPQFTK